MASKFRLIFQLLLISCTTAAAQGVFFEAISVEGTARVQRARKQQIEAITVGTRLSDNDLVETSLQSKILLRFGDNNLIIVAPNTKVLFNIASKEIDKGIITDVRLTLFGGGIFTKAISNCHISFHSPNAVGEMDSGAVSMVTDTKNGETGFQVLNGLVQVRNIAQSKSMPLRYGLTTMILPNREPTAPLYITHRHVAVLKHNFGAEYIANELNTSGIEPTEDYGSASRLGSSSKLSAAFADSSDPGMHKSTFSLNKVYGSLQRAQEYFRFYEPITRQQNATSNKGYLKFHYSLGIFSGGANSGFALIPSIHLPSLHTALQFSFNQNVSSSMNSGFSSASGILDKIQYFRLGNLSDSTFISLGKIEDYSLGYGLIVDHFSNQDPNRIFNSAGINVQIQKADVLNIKAFLGNLTNPFYGGTYVSYSPAAHTIGVGYYFDFDLYKVKYDPDEFRYELMETVDDSIADHLNPAHSHIYEIDLATEIFSVNDLKMNILFEFAQKIQGGNDGIVARIPTMLWDIRRMQLGASLVVETKRLLSSHFSPFYLSNRYRVKKDQSGFHNDTVYTQNNYLSKKRQSTGLAFTFKTNPVKGLDLEIYYKQDFLSKNTLDLIHSNQGHDSALNVPGDFTVLLNCRVNDTLVPFIKYGEIYFQQYHGRLFPADASIFLSWGMQSGINLVTRPLFKRLSFEAGGRLLYIDRNHDNSVGGKDLIFEILLGMQWGFL
jgi:hypothetical protein